MVSSHTQPPLSQGQNEWVCSIMDASVHGVTTKGVCTALHLPPRAKEDRWQKRHKQKSHYEAGMWNVNAVMMGGLGGDPGSGTSSSDEGEWTKFLTDLGIKPDRAVRLGLEEVQNMPIGHPEVFVLDSFGLVFNTSGGGSYWEGLFVCRF